MYDDRHRRRFKGIALASHKGFADEKQKSYQIDKNGNILFTHTHNHKDFEIIYIKSGSGIFYIDGEEKVFSAGDIFFINPYEIHSSVAFKDKLPLSFYCITGDLSILGDTARLSKELEEGSKKCENYLPSETNGDIAATFEKLEKYFEEKADGWEFFVAGYLHQIFGKILESGLCRKAERENKNKLFVKNVQKYIEENFVSDIKSSDAAAALCYDQSYFCRLFKKNFGQSFGEYLSYYRINVAKNHLLAGDSVLKAAMATGFNNLSYFTKVFKKYTMVLPSRFAKNLTE